MILTCPECKARYIVNPKALLPRGRTVRCAKCSHSWFEDKPKEEVEVVTPNDKASDAEQQPNEEQQANKSDAVAQDTNKEKADEGNKEPESAKSEDDFDFPINNPKKRRRPIPKGSNLPALQNQKYGSNKLGWISLMVFITLIISGFLIFQEEVTNGWPAANKLYVAIGLDQSPTEAKPAEPEIEPVEDRLKIGGLTPRRENINNISHLVIAGYVENISDETQNIPDLKVTLLDANRNIVRDWIFSPKTNTVGVDEQAQFETSLPSPPPEARDISITFAAN